MRKFALASAAIAALFVSVPAAATTTILSEDFSAGLGAFTTLGQVGIATGNDYVSCCGTSGTAANMANPFVTFGSGDLPSGTLRATLGTQAATVYTVTFNLGTLGAGSDPLTVFANGGVLGIFTAAADNNLDTTLQQQETVQFTATGSTTILDFQSAGTVSADAVLDNVRVFTLSDVPGGVPEPATWVMMLLGFGAIGLSMRHGRRSVALALEE